MSLLALLIAHFRHRAARAALVALTGIASVSGQTAGVQQIGIGDHSYQVELATTPEARGKGLMYRHSLDPRGGMLLVYPREGDHRIWMKNVPIALRVYWIDSNFEVIGARRLPPCQADPCPVYAANKPSRYVLELADRDHDLKTGDRIRGLGGLQP